MEVGDSLPLHALLGDAPSLREVVGISPVDVHAHAEVCHGVVGPRGSQKL